MSFIRITEFDREPVDRAGACDWYRPDDSGLLVRIARSATLHGLPPTDEDVAAIRTDWCGVRLLRDGEDRRGALTYHLKFPVPESFFYEFEAWYREEHVPMLLTEPTWYACELYRAMGPGYYTYAAVHDLEPSALTSAARDRSVASDWWKHLNEQSWFHDEFLRMRLIPHA